MVQGEVELEANSIDSNMVIPKAWGIETKEEGVNMVICSANKEEEKKCSVKEEYLDVYFGILKSLYRKEKKLKCMDKIWDL